MLRGLCAVGAQQLRVPCQIVCPVSGKTALALSAQRATKPRQQTRALGIRRRMELVRPKGQQLG
jgi:hypothetical protein